MSVSRIRVRCSRTAIENAAIVFSGASAAPPRCAMWTVGTRPLRNGCRAPSLLTFEARRSFLVVGADSLRGVFAEEQLLLKLSFQGKPFGEARLKPGHHRTLDSPDRLRGSAGRNELARVFVGFLKEILAGGNAVQESQGMRLVDGQVLSFDHELDGFGASDRSCQALRPSSAREHPEVDFRESDLGIALSREAQIGRQGDLEPAADAVPVDRRDDQLRGLFEAGEGLVRVETELVLEGGIHF